MVRLLNSPQQQPIVREDPLMKGFGQIAMAGLERMGEVAKTRRDQKAKSAEIMQKLIPSLVEAGATNEEAVAAATKMVGKMNDQAPMQPMMTPLDVPFMGQMNFPNLGNMGANAWEMMREPTRAPANYNIDQFESQKTLGERGMDFSFLPGKAGAVINKMTLKDAKELDPIIKAYLDFIRPRVPTSFYGWGGAGGTGKLDEKLLSLASANVNKIISEDPEYNKAKWAEDGDAAEARRSELIIEEYYRLKFLSQNPNRKVEPAKKDVDNKNPAGLAKPKKKG